MSLWTGPQPLVLASRSAARRAMLAAAGIPIDIATAEIDERAVEARAGSPAPAQAALLLAREKALTAAAAFAGRWVVGADQTLALGERRFSKPGDPAGARAQLRALSGQTHELHSAVAVVRDGRVAFDHLETARLTMRPLSDQFIDTYLKTAGADVRASVGGYQLEKLGVHLFECIEGDHFTILGMPLVALLAFLRREGQLAG